MCLPFTEKAIIVLSCLTQSASGGCEAIDFPFAKFLTGAFAGYFSAIKLVIGRTIFGNYCAAASLLGIQRVASCDSAPYSQTSRAPVYIG
jgi:hypothetical protein